jgi:hypothetical protein
MLRDRQRCMKYSRRVRESDNPCESRENLIMVRENVHSQNVTRILPLVGLARVCESEATEEIRGTPAVHLGLSLFNYYVLSTLYFHYRIFFRLRQRVLLREHWVESHGQWCSNETCFYSVKRP